MHKIIPIKHINMLRVTFWYPYFYSLYLLKIQRKSPFTNRYETTAKLSFSKGLLLIGTILEELFYARLCCNVVNDFQFRLIQHTIVVFIQHKTEHRTNWLSDDTLIRALTY